MKKYLILSCMLLITNITAMKKPSKKIPDHIDMVIALDEGGPNTSEKIYQRKISFNYTTKESKIPRSKSWLMYYTEPLSEIVIESIVDDIIIFGTANLLYNLYTLSSLPPDPNLIQDTYSGPFKEIATKILAIQSGPNNLSKNYNIYLDSSGNFFLALPKKYANLNLADLGFNSKLKLVPADQLNKTFLNKKYKKPIKLNIEQLNNLILPKFTPKKRIYLIGHGAPKDKIKPLIAQLDPQQYRQFLNHLDKAGTQFLYIASCYSSGWNIVQFHKQLRDEQNKILKQLQTNFPIVLGATSDNIMFVNKITLSKTRFRTKPINLKQFFSSLDQFFGKRKGQDKHWLRKPLLETLQYVSNKQLYNIPSILFPGDHQFFRAVNVDEKVFILTYPVLLTHELKPIQQAKTPKEKLKIAKEPQPLEIKNKKLILLYPSIINVPLNLVNSKKIISMIPGNAHHFIKKIIIDQPTSMLPSIFQQAISPDNPVRSNKAFFIATIKGPDYTINNVLYYNYITHSNQPSGGLRLDTLFLFKHNEKYYKYDSKKQALEGENYNDITSKQIFLQDIKNALSKTKPNPAALSEASGGIENEKQFNKLINKYLQ